MNMSVMRIGKEKVGGGGMDTFDQLPTQPLDFFGGLFGFDC